MTKTSFVNYAFDALLINEFLDAGTFQFTPKWNDANSHSRSQISVDVTGREVLQFFSFGDTHAQLAGGPSRPLTPPTPHQRFTRLNSSVPSL